MPSKCCCADTCRCEDAPRQVRQAAQQGRGALIPREHDKSRCSCQNSALHKLLFQQTFGGRQLDSTTKRQQMH